MARDYAACNDPAVVEWRKGKVRRRWVKDTGEEVGRGQKEEKTEE